MRMKTTFLASLLTSLLITGPSGLALTEDSCHGYKVSSCCCCETGSEIQGPQLKSVIPCGCQMEEETPKEAFPILINNKNEGSPWVILRRYTSDFNVTAEPIEVVSFHLSAFHQSHAPPHLRAPPINTFRLV